MKTSTLGISACLVIFISGELTSANADPPPPVLEVPSVTGSNGLTSTDFSLYKYLRIDDYASKGDGGGGYFVLDTSTGSANACHNGQDFGVTLFDSTGTNCFLRRFTGAVHLKWYGVTNAVSDWSSLLNNAISAAKKYGNGCVDLDGLQVHIGSLSCCRFHGHRV